MRSPPWRLARATYPYFTSFRTRFRDQDILRHVNNMAIAEYYDEARSRFSDEVFSRLDGEPYGRIVTAESTVTYLAEVFHPRTLEVACGVLAVGRASYQIGQALFLDDRCLGLCTTTFVRSDPEEGVRHLTPRMRRVLGELAVDQPAV